MAQVTDTAKCDAAKKTFDQASENARRYELLVFIFSCALVVASIALVVFVFFVDSSEVGLKVSALATVASGGAITFVVTQLKAAQKRRDQALKDVATYCGDAQLTTILAS